MNLDFTPKLYVGTYRKYNNGSLTGKWVRLNQFNNAEEFFKYITDWHKDESDPEFMFQDSQDIPDFLYSESMSLPQIQRLYEALPVLYETGEWSDEQWIEAYNSMHEDKLHIYRLESDFFDTHPCITSKGDAVSKVLSGDFRWSDEWATLDEVGNVKSFMTFALKYHIDQDEIIQHMIEARKQAAE